MSPEMFVEAVPVAVNMKTLKKRLIDCTQVHDRVAHGRGEESGNREKSCRSVCSQV